MNERTTDDYRATLDKIRVELGRFCLTQLRLGLPLENMVVLVVDASYDGFRALDIFTATDRERVDIAPVGSGFWLHGSRFEMGQALENCNHDLAARIRTDVGRPNNIDVIIAHGSRLKFARFAVGAPVSVGADESSLIEVASEMPRGPKLGSFRQFGENDKPTQYRAAPPGTKIVT